MERSEGHPLAGLIVAGAKACVGMPFRPQGRGVGGVDCLGVVLVAAARAGISIEARHDYCLRGEAVVGIIEELCAKGFWQLPWGAVRPGDLLLAAPARRQVHFAMRTEKGLVEAHLGMRRVIERPLADDDQWISGWRLPLSGGEG